MRLHGLLAALLTSAPALACPDGQEEPRVAVLGWSADGRRLATATWEETGLYGAPSEIRIVDVYDSQTLFYRAWIAVQPPRELVPLLVEGIHGRDLSAAPAIWAEAGDWLRDHGVSPSLRTVWRDTDRADGVRVVLDHHPEADPSWIARVEGGASPWRIPLSRMEEAPARWLAAGVPDPSEPVGSVAAQWHRTLAVETVPSPDGRHVAVTVRRAHTDGCWVWDRDDLRVIALEPEAVAGVE